MGHVDEANDHDWQQQSGFVNSFSSAASFLGPLTKGFTNRDDQQDPVGHRQEIVGPKNVRWRKPHGDRFWSKFVDRLDSLKRLVLTRNESRAVAVDAVTMKRALPRSMASNSSDMALSFAGAAMLAEKRETSIP